VTLLPLGAVNAAGIEPDRRLVRVAGVRRQIERRWSGPRWAMKANEDLKNVMEVK
jgi:hypothetical protein